jgi:hypothetical protein
MGTKNIFPVLFLIVVFSSASAQKKDSVIFHRPMSDSTFFHFNILMNMGGGFEQLNTGIVTSNGEQVKLSPGGGVGIGIQLGYLLLSSHWDFSIALSRQWSTMTPPVSNAEGTFSRTLIEPMVKYIITFKDKNKSVNLGAGILFAQSGKTDLDAGKIQGGAHNIYSYSDATGLLIAAEYLARRKNFGFHIGLKYYSVNYELASISSNGVNIPLAVIPPSLISDIREIDGSGVDLVIGIGFYFD